MRDNYDFSDAIKNPFAGREKGKFDVKVHYDFTKTKIPTEKFELIYRTKERYLNYKYFDSEASLNKFVEKNNLHVLSIDRVEVPDE